MAAPPPPLDYATPEPVRKRLMALLAFNEAWFCAFAIVPAAALAASLSEMLLPIDGRVAVIVFVIAIAFWPALLVERVVIGRPSPMAMMRPLSAAFVLLMLAACIVLLQGGEDAARHFLFTSVHLTTFAWLATSAVRRRLLPRLVIAGLTLAMLVTSVRVQRCPHSTTLGVFGVPIYREGHPCNNTQVWRPWWADREP